MNLSGGSVVKHMSGPSSSACRRSGDGVSDQFPAGLRVLVVDDDPTCLRILEQMLWKCYYEVTKCNRAEVALSLLRENKNGFDIVLSDVHMPDMDGFKLLEHIGLEMDLPVIMMSADDSRSVVLNGVTHGACDYLIKPVRIEALKNIWQHVVRKKKHEWKDKDFDQSGSMEGTQQQKPPEDVECSSSANEGSWKSSKKRKEEDEAEERDDTSSLKKPRVVWSVELHQQFVQSVNQLGVDKAVPKKILEMMNVPGLTRENVASHLQKYRLYLRRLSNGSQHQNGLHNSFMGHPDDNFGAMSSFNGLDFQALAATGQLPPHSLATLQVAALNRSATKSSISVPLIDQRNLFSFENPMLRFPEGQQQLNNSNNQVDLLHGIPTTMEPKQLAKLHQSSQSFVRMNMQGNSSAQQNNSLLMRMSQPQSRAQMLNEANNGSQVSRLPLSMPQQPLSSNMIPGLSRSGIVDNARGGVYNQVSQASSTVDFSLHQNTELEGYNFPLVSSNSEMSTLTSKRRRQDEVNSDARGFPLDYDIFSELHQQKAQWGLQNVGSTFNGNHNSSIQGTLDVSPSMLFQQGISSTKKNGQNKNAPIPNTVFSSGQESVHVSPMDGPHRNSLLKGNLLTVKADRLLNANYQSTIFPEQFGQEDLMSALLEQQESVGPVGGEFGFDGYPLDNLPV